MDLLDLDGLADEPFEVDAQAAYLFKHPHLGLDDVTTPGRAIHCSIRPSHLPTG